MTTTTSKAQKSRDSSREKELKKREQKKAEEDRAERKRQQKERLDGLLFNLRGKIPGKPRKCDCCDLPTIFEHHYMDAQKIRELQSYVENFRQGTVLVFDSTP